MSTSFSTAAIACVTLAILTSSQNLLITWSKWSGGYSYNYVSVTLMVELVKLLLSFFFLFREQKLLRASKSLLLSGDGQEDPRVSLVDWRFELSFEGLYHRLPYALPGVIYFLKNNLVFYGLRFLDPVQFQLLGNLKILTTTLLYRIIMKKQLSDLELVAILLLAVGLTVSQLKSEDSVSVTPQAMLIMGAIAMLSGLAGVVSEWLMKSNPRRRAESLHIQNIWLYFYGILFNLLAVLGDDLEAVFRDGFFHGYTFVTLLIVINNSSSGIAVSAIMKYANNLVKLFTFAVSLILTTLLSIQFFNFQLTLHFCLGASIVLVSIYLFRRKDATYF